MKMSTYIAFLDRFIATFGNFLAFHAIFAFL